MKPFSMTLSNTSFKLLAGIVGGLLVVGAIAAKIGSGPHSFRECIDNTNLPSYECRQKFPKTEVELLREQMKAESDLRQQAEDNLKMQQAMHHNQSKGPTMCLYAGQGVNVCN